MRLCGRVEFSIRSYQRLKVVACFLSMLFWPFCWKCKVRFFQNWNRTNSNLFQFYFFIFQLKAKIRNISPIFFLQWKGRPYIIYQLSICQFQIWWWMKMLITSFFYFHFHCWIIRKFNWGNVLYQIENIEHKSVEIGFFIFFSLSLSLALSVLFAVVVVMITDAFRAYKCGKIGKLFTPK